MSDPNQSLSGMQMSHISSDKDVSHSLVLEQLSCLYTSHDKLIPSPAGADSTTIQRPLGPRAWYTAAHPSAPLLATCLADKSVRIYNISKLESVPQIRKNDSGPTDTSGLGRNIGDLHSTVEGGHKRSVRACAWKPNLIHKCHDQNSVLPKQGTGDDEHNWRTWNREMVLATASFDASVGIWRMVNETRDGEAFDTRDQHMPRADGLAGGIGDNVEEEDKDDWRFAVALDGHDSEVKSVAWSAGGNFLATCSRDKSVWVWEEMDADNDEYETVAVLQEHEGDVKCVAWHPEEELLASGSYDDEIRLWKDEGGDDWGCVWVGRGHTSTVWQIGFEGTIPHIKTGVSSTEVSESSRRAWLRRREISGPRLISCSEDGSVKIWRRIAKPQTEQSRFSIIKSADAGENWSEEVTLPDAHSRGVYAVAWSRHTGLIASCGGDGKIVVYQEMFTDAVDPAPLGENSDTQELPADNVRKEGASSDVPGEPVAKTHWSVVAELSDAHGVFEVNHITWAPRANIYHTPSDETQQIGSEWLVSTGDDGAVRVWAVSLAK